MRVRDAIGAAIERAIEVRGTYVVELKRDPGMRVHVSAAVDGSLELVVQDQGRPKGLLRRSRGALDPAEMHALGFRMDHAWVSTVPAHPGAAAGAASTMERLFTGPLGISLDANAELWCDYTGVVPGWPMAPAGAPYAEHLRVTTALFELDPDADILIAAGRPSWTYLHLQLTDHGRVEVHVTGREGEPLEIPGFTASSEIEGALQSDYELEELPAVAAGLLHEHLAVGEGEPLFIELGSLILPDE